MPRVSAWLRCSALRLLSLPVLAACVVGVSPGCVARLDAEAATSELVDIDTELTFHFNDAARYCDLRLFDVPLYGAAAVGDRALEDYGRWPATGIITGPHAGETPEHDADRATNACRYPTSVALGQMFGGIHDGFCRADFNYCLGMELGLHAQSLPSGSEQSALKAAILRRARERLQAASEEYVASLAFYERICVSEPGTVPPQYRDECLRLVPGATGSYLPVAHDRLLESVSQIVSFAQTEAGLRVDVGDRSLRETPLEDPADAIPALYGAHGSRTAGVEVLYGPADGVAFETRWNYRRLGPVALPLVAPNDERATQALELLRRNRVLLPFVRANASAPIMLVGGVSPGVYFNVLDHRLAAARFLPPYEHAIPDPALPADPAIERGNLLRSLEPLEYADVVGIATDTFALHDSILYAEERITPDDLREAILLAADAYETQFGRFIFEPQLYPDGGAGTDTAHYLALTEANATPRPARMLAAAFSDEQGLPHADPLAPRTRAMPRNAVGLAAGDWYDWDLRRVDGTQEATVSDDVRAALGAAGALHILRVHLLRLAAIGGGFIDTDKTEQALDLIEHAIGGVWTEHDDHADTDCACLPQGGGQGDPIPAPGAQPRPRAPLPPPQICPRRDDQPLYLPCKACGGLCRLETNTANAARWDMYYPAEVESLYAGGAPVVAWWIDEVRCLLDERAPGTSEPCALAPASLPAVVGPVTTRIGRTRRSYLLPPPAVSATHYYILWRDAEGHYRLLDVFPVARPVGVHPLGGVFLDGAASAWAHDPWRPAAPSVSATGLVRDLVPPLESELISDSDTYEDSFARYLADARNAVDLARGQLTRSRDEELLARQNERSDEARLEEAALVETGELADVCGDLPGCELPRVGEITLADLGIVGPPPPEPDLGTYADCEAVQRGMFTDFIRRTEIGFSDDVSAQDFVRAHMLRVVGCSLHLYLSELARVRMDGLPVAVRDALARDDGGEFTSYSGEVREHLIALYFQLDGIRSDVRRLQTQRFATERLIEVAARELSVANTDSFETDLCLWGTGLGLASDFISLVASAAGAQQSFASADRAFGAANRFAATDPATGNTLYQHGLSDLNSGFRSTGHGFGAAANMVARTQRFVATDSCGGQDAAVTTGARGAQEVAASMQTMVALAANAHVAARDTFFTISSIDALERRAQLAGRRRAVAGLLAASDSLADVPEWHSRRSFHQRRAEGALLRAQRATFVARRAIEFRLAVDLTTMHAPEPLTPAPSTWADSLFDVGAAVLPVPEAESDVSIAAEELDLYLDRLERFVDGYPIARRFRDAGDLQVIDLGALLEADASVPITEQMFFQCSGHPDALPAGRLPGATPTPGAGPCAGLGEVEWAEIRFAVPSRLASYLADRLAAGSFNYRHELLAPNFVGTGVLDCERAYDPAECYGDGNVPYSLRHDGPFVLENFERQLLTYFMEPGVIEGGRALVAERSFTTPLSSADRTYVTPYYRHELRGRPLSGLYTLRVEGRPEVQWARLERIQLLLGYRYWTRQE